MSSCDYIEYEGTITEALAGGKFRVQLNGTTNEIIASLSGKLRINYIKCIVGDKVTVQISPYDTTKGRITWRSKG